MSKESDVRLSPRLRIGLEAVAVVISILLAFGIDAWWGSLGERREEQQILRGLQEEFKQHRSYTARRLELNEGTRRGIETLQGLSGDNVRDSTGGVEVVEAIRSLSISPASTQLRGAVLDGLIGSGRLELIRDRRLRDELGRWSLLAVGAEGQDESVNRFVMEQLFPYIASLGVPLSEALSPGPDGIYFGNISIGAPGEYDALLNDRQFFNLMSIRRLWLTGTHVRYTSAGEVADGVLALIAENLEP